MVEAVKMAAYVIRSCELTPSNIQFFYILFLSLIQRMENKYERRSETISWQEDYLQNTYVFQHFIFIAKLPGKNENRACGRYC